MVENIKNLLLKLENLKIQERIIIKLKDKEDFESGFVKVEHGSIVWNNSKECLIFISDPNKIEHEINLDEIIDFRILKPNFVYE